MTFPALKLIVNTTPTPADLDRAWREAAWLFLNACFAGAGKPQIDRLADAFARAREALAERKGYGP